MAGTGKYSQEVRERAVRMVFEHESRYGSRWETIRSISQKLGCSTEALRNWVKRAEIDAGRMGEPCRELDASCAAIGARRPADLPIGVRAQLGVVTDSNFLDNSATVDGGAIYATNGSTADVQRSLFIGNTATANGGALALNGSGVAFTVTNSTLIGNAADRGGALHAAASVTLLNDTLEANRSEAGGALWHDSGTVRAKNTILHGSSALDGLSPQLDCDGPPILSDGFNVMGDTSCNGNTNLGDQIGVDPLLGTLSDNGGPTLTLLPAFGTPAIDAGTNTGCPSVDQRSAPRPRDGDENGSAICDVGAVEVPEPAVALMSAASLGSLLILACRTFVG